MSKRGKFEPSELSTQPNPHRTAYEAPLFALYSPSTHVAQGVLLLVVDKVVVVAEDEVVVGKACEAGLMPVSAPVRATVPP